jgi:hypothetical protein
MAVNLRKKYYGKKEVSIKNRPYRYQLDFHHNGKRIRETIKEQIIQTSINDNDKKGENL